jgi:hypothetical protein
VNLAFPLIYLVATAYIIIFPFTKSPTELLAALVIILLGLPAYLLCIVWKSKPRLIQSRLGTYLCDYKL